MIINTTPSEWNSVHRPIEYVYDHETRDLDSFTDVGGNVRLVVSSAFTHTPVAGDQIVVEKFDSDYNEYMTVVSVTGTQILTDYDYATFLDEVPADPVVKFIRLPEITLYKGYTILEEYPVDLPLELVAAFTPENSPTNDVRFDVSEYLKSIFEILPPTEGVDFNMFNRFRIRFDGTYKEPYQVLNSSIKTEDLMSDYVDTGAYLNSQTPPVVFSCGKTILSTLTGNVVVNHVYDGEIPGSGDYSPADYDGDDYYLMQ